MTVLATVGAAPPASAALRHVGGDPNGHILGQLAALRSALPPGATHLVANRHEPTWAATGPNCRRSGWGTAYYVVSFESALPKAAVVAATSRRMTRLGWGRRRANAGGTWGWRRRLTDGSEATAGLVHGRYSVNPDDNWTLSSQAAPLPPVAVCGSP